MLGTILTNKDGVPEIPLSEYQPPEQVKVLTSKIRQDYEVGHNILNRPFEEFNDMSLIQRMDANQKIYNIYTEPKSDNPDDEWRWNGVTATGHNKVISMAAHFVASTLIPGAFAQNDQDEEDKLAAEVMRYLMEYNIRNSDYEMSYLYAVVNALVNPVAYLHEEFSEAMQNIRLLREDGSVNTEQVADEILSGFQVNNIPADEIMIANAYQFHLQRQRFLVRRRFIDYDEAKMKYRGHKNLKYIQPGVKVLYNEKDAAFYDQKDDALSTLCEEAIYYNRLEDAEIPFLNGIYMGKTDTEANIMRHRDGENRPKYPLSKIGYQPIDEKRFFFYRSAIMNFYNDQKLEDKVTRMMADGTFLKLFPPVVGIGTGKIDSNIIFPGSAHNVPSESKIDTIRIDSDLAAAQNLLIGTTQRIDESSQSKIMEGQLSTERKTAYEIGRAEKNARIQLSIFGRQLSRFVSDFGTLMTEDILRHQAVGEAEETLAGDIRVKFGTFLLPNQTEQGKKITRKIRFKSEMMGEELSQAQEKKEKYRIMDEEGGIDPETRIYEVNPELFSKLKFKIFLEVDELMPKNEAFEKFMKLEAYNRLITNPFVDQKAVTRDFLVEPLAKGESDKYMLKEGAQPEVPLMAGAGAAQQPLPAPTARSKSLMQLLQESE